MSVLSTTMQARTQPPWDAPEHRVPPGHLPGAVEGHLGFPAPRSAGAGGQHPDSSTWRPGLGDLSLRPQQTRRMQTLPGRTVKLRQGRDIALRGKETIRAFSCGKHFFHKREKELPEDVQIKLGCLSRD